MVYTPLPPPAHTASRCSSHLHTWNSLKARNLRSWEGEDSRPPSTTTFQNASRCFTEVEAEAEAEVVPEAEAAMPGSSSGSRWSHREWRRGLELMLPYEEEGGEEARVGADAALRGGVQEKGDGKVNAAQEWPRG